ncbi:dihydroorotate oxidase [Sphaeroforma arctica JP610]|uniref:Dihydroorotate dehydrogenase (quinone), mitochondrial n=1 Tax=Sphaeroforma arctica JP610 TaxID=667725 RepID=A0A0L0G3L3_9EUKA|nr:dihydroorotate oxidase [Sphaeroforma arctica JP610]KNC83454.1 dihydroorotate oxidase [Sphaeroforma arctica JP610]|eukprot:XP_014157356.1 dihydroorotate oxidase [Sphaeroforma arctica JP610]
MLARLSTSRHVARWQQTKIRTATTTTTTNKPKRTLIRGVLKVTAGAAVAAGGLLVTMSQCEYVERQVFAAVFPLAQRLTDPESAHRMAIVAYSAGLMPKDNAPDDPFLKTQIWGRTFVNPIGIAAGFDKNGEAVDGVFDGGAGFVECGSVTPMPQAGNEKPRVFRLLEDGAVINRYGFNSVGVQMVEENLQARVTSGKDAEQCQKQRVFGVNVGKNKASTELSEDFVTGIIVLGGYADFVVVNVSSPNTPGLRSLQGKEALTTLINDAKTARDSLQMKSRKDLPPLLIKIAPDLNDIDIEDIAEVALATGVDGLIVSNTTISRPVSLQSENRTETGGLSGKPLMEMSTEVLSKVYKLTGGKVPLIGVGGVASGADAYRKIKAGASLVQLYSSFALEGPHKIIDVKRELAQLLKRDGYESVAQAVGADHKKQ